MLDGREFWTYFISFFYVFSPVFVDLFRVTSVGLKITNKELRYLTTNPKIGKKIHIHS